jgi:hypothetical protein
MMICTATPCHRPARTYIEAMKQRHGSQHWIGGYFCEDDLILFKFNAHEDGYEVTKEIPAEHAF